MVRQQWRRVQKVEDLFLGYFGLLLIGLLGWMADHVGHIRHPGVAPRCGV